MNYIEKGFTLIELIVTITIFVVLTAVAIPSFLWINKYSTESSYNEVKAFIGYARNNAILTNSYSCVQKAEDTAGQYLKIMYLKQENAEKTQVLRLGSKIHISSSLDGQENMLVCFYPNGFIVNGKEITPTASLLADVMNPSTSTYYKSISYSNLDQIKLTINTVTSTDSSKFLCLSKGGEFKQCT